MLCDTCKTIISRGPATVGDDKSYPRHHTNIESFCASVKRNCYICIKIWNHFTENCQKDLKGFTEDFEETWYILWNEHYENLPDAGQSSHSLTIFLHLSSRPKPSLDKSFVVSADFSRLAGLNRNTTSTASEASWSLLTQWIATCTSNHERCNKPAISQGFVPSRLIDAGSSDAESKICLVHTNVLRGTQRYMSLSHCWGSVPVVKLTSATRTGLESGFDISELPNTYRDAVSIVRKLGVRYIWIDSLCILQDSPDDWRKEASTMRDIYQNSLCNIASTGASNADEPMFTERDPIVVRPRMKETDWSTSADSKDFIIEKDFWRIGVSSAPLNRRGWVIQERLLAPRVLHFGKDQLFWECHELDSCETFPFGVPEIFSRFGGTKFKGIDPDIDGERLRLPRDRDTDHDFRPYLVWDQILSAYRECDLTNSEDKLVAISGIVKEMQQHLDGDEYLAGLWRRHLVPELLWSCWGTESGARTNPKRALQYRAPSWSWAAIDGGRSGPRFRGGNSLVKIIDAGVTPVTDDVTGQIKDGYIRLQGDLIPVSLSNDSDIHWIEMKVDGVRLGLAHQFQIDLDVDIDSITGNLYALPMLLREEMSMGHPTGSAWLSGLILQSTGHRQGEYYRQGYWWTDEELKHHFDSPATEKYYRPELYEEGRGRTILLV